MLTTVVVSLLVSFGVNAGCHIYKKHETNKIVGKIEEKYTPLFKDCSNSFMILMNEIKKDKDELL